MRLTSAAVPSKRRSTTNSTVASSGMKIMVPRWTVSHAVVFDEAASKSVSPLGWNSSSTPQASGTPTTKAVSARLNDPRSLMAALSAGGVVESTLHP